MLVLMNCVAEILKVIKMDDLVNVLGALSIIGIFIAFLLLTIFT